MRNIESVDSWIKLRRGTQSTERSHGGQTAVPERVE
jgi:hypothetical protein